MKNALLAATFFTFTASAGICCTMSDIEIKQASWSYKGGQEYLRIVGEIINHCNSDVGVQLQAVFRNSTGQVAKAEEFWPASVRNIAAGKSYPFETLISSDGPVAKMEMSVIEVKRW